MPNSQFKTSLPALHSLQQLTCYPRVSPFSLHSFPSPVLPSSIPLQICPPTSILRLLYQ